MSGIDWSKAPEGYPLWLEYMQKAIDSDESRLESGGCWVSDRGDRYVTILETFWSKPDEGFYRIHERPSPSWSGEGLPSAGVVCEAKCMARGRERDWFKATVNYSSRCTVVLDDGSVGEFVAHPATMQFRPIRTPEQIAADEREAAVAEMLIDCRGASSRDTFLMQRLYDAGYRKHENQK